MSAYIVTPAFSSAPKSSTATPDKAGNVSAVRAARWSRRGLLSLILLVLGMVVLPMVAAADATTKCTPNNAPVGTPINVAMTGLPAKENLTITTMSAGVVLTRQQVTTDASGNISINLDTTKDAVGDYTVQALNAAGTMLTQGRYTLTAARPALPQTGGGYAAQADAQPTLIAGGFALGLLVLCVGVAGITRRQRP